MTAHVADDFAGVGAEGIDPVSGESKIRHFTGKQGERMTFRRLAVDHIPCEL
jgi:hypothetical protein